eukprot:2826835-Lingulodinium_polyedra.AAC.1
MYPEEFATRMMCIKGCREHMEYEEYLQYEAFMDYVESMRAQKERADLAGVWPWQGPGPHCPFGDPLPLGRAAA